MSFNTFILLIIAIALGVLIGTHPRKIWNSLNLDKWFPWSIGIIAILFTVYYLLLVIKDSTFFLLGNFKKQTFEIIYGALVGIPWLILAKKTGFLEKGQKKRWRVFLIGGFLLLIFIILLTIFLDVFLPLSSFE